MKVPATAIVQKCKDRLLSADNINKVNYENFWKEGSTYFGVTFWVSHNNFTFHRVVFCTAMDAFEPQL